MKSCGSTGKGILTAQCVQGISSATPPTVMTPHSLWQALIPAFLAILFANVTSTQQTQSSIQHKPLPAYVLQLAPLSHLHSQEEWFPSDISVHLTHVVPQINFTNVSSSVTFQSIGRLSSEVFLTSKDPVEDEPEWMFSTENKPDEGGAGGKVGRSGAPATIICVEKAGGTILDVFYFYFYSFNEGSDVSPLLSQFHLFFFFFSSLRQHFPCAF